MLHYAISLQNLVQDLKRPAAFHHVIFRDDFKPVDNRLLFKNMIVMRNAEPDSYAEVFVFIEAICGHKADKERGFLKYFEIEDQRCSTGPLHLRGPETIACRPLFPWACRLS